MTRSDSLLEKRLEDLYKYQNKTGILGCLHDLIRPCLLYTSDAADDMQCVDLGGRRIIKKRERMEDRGEE